MPTYSLKSKYNGQRLKKLATNHPPSIAAGVVNGGRPKANTPYSKNTNGITVAETAAIHEFGTKDGTIPERSFLRELFRSGRRDLTKAQFKILRKYMLGQITGQKAANMLGLFAESFLKEQFQTGGRGKWPALAPDNRRAKKQGGKAKPLVDTGELRDAQTYEVLKDGVRGKLLK